MSNEFKDVLRVETSGATGVSDILRNKQTGYESATPYRQGRKLANGTMIWWTPDGYINATGILYTNSFFPAVGNVQEMLDSIGYSGVNGATGLAGATGAQAQQGATGLQGMTGVSSLGSTGLSVNTFPRVASDGKLVNSNLTETGLYGTYQGTDFIVKRTDGTTQYHGAKLDIMRDDAIGATGVKSYEQTRLSFIGRDSAGNTQSYGSIRAYCTDPTNGSEAGTVSIDVGDSDAESEKLRITRFGGVQTVASTPLVVGDSLLEWTTNQTIAFGIPTGAQSGTWENDEIGMAGRMFITDVTDGGCTVEGLSNKTSADTALSLIGRCVSNPGSVGAISADCCTQNGAAATGIATDSAIMAFKNGGVLKSAATVWGDGDVGDRYQDIFSSCTFGNGLTGIAGYIGVKKIGRTAFFNVWLNGSCTGPLTKTIELPEAYRACTGMPQALFSHNCSNAGTWGAGCGYMSSYVEKKIYLTSTPDPNQGLWSGGGFATQFQFFSECQV